MPYILAKVHVYVLSKHAMVINLLPIFPNVPYAHMTLFHSNCVLTNDDVAKVQEFVDNFTNGAPQSFTLKHWGPCSDLIEGDLERLCYEVRHEFSHMYDAKQRLPHVALRCN